MIGLGISCGWAGVEREVKLHRFSVSALFLFFSLSVCGTNLKNGWHHQSEWRSGHCRYNNGCWREDDDETEEGCFRRYFQRLYSSGMLILIPHLQPHMIKIIYICSKLTNKYAYAWDCWCNWNWKSRANCCSSFHSNHLLHIMEWLGLLTSYTW